jgi:5-methylcytosine-specific restriction enzyme subunit McrC
MEHLFEFGKWVAVEDANWLKQYLVVTWDNRISDPNQQTLDSTDLPRQFQPFLQFDGDRIRANNYVGFIQHHDSVIEIYPKVFRADGCNDKSMMLRHIFFWLDYCRKWKFPFTKSTLDTQTFCNFPELIIHLMASQIHETISTQPYLQYSPVEESLVSPKGHVNFRRYIQENFIHGNGHMIACDHEPFLYDNVLNRCIKYCVRLLARQTRLTENIRLLEQCVYVLDDVEDTAVTATSLESVNLNPFYQDYTSVAATCDLIIRQQLYSPQQYDLTQWCLLFPMEYIFEDFLAGFLQKHFTPGWKVEYQKSDEYLSNEPEVFNMQHDIFLTKGKRRIIIDTKYKLRSPQFKTDPKRGIDQGDLYQVVSYAFKRGCTEVFLVYPNLNETLNEPDGFKIKTGFNTEYEITVKAIEIPFWSLSNFNQLESKLFACLANQLDQL